MESLTHEIEDLIQQFKKAFVLRIIEEYELDITPEEALVRYDTKKKQKNKKIIDPSEKCNGVTKKGISCNKKAGESGYCHQHTPK